MSTNDERPTMRELRSLPRFPFEMFDVNSPPMQIVKAWQSILSTTVPQDPTEDFYVGVDWMISLLYVLARKGAALSIPLLADLAIALMKFKDDEENPFEDKRLFDSEIKTVKEENAVIERLLEKLREIQRKEILGQDEV